MIKNEKQYKITKSKLKDLKRSLKVCKEGTFPDKIIYKAMVDSLKSLMADLKNEIQEYENLKNKKVPTLKISSLAELPDLLVRSRISHGWTQKQLAETLDMPAHQIQRYESESYRRVSFEALLNISRTLNLDLDKVSRVRIFYSPSSKAKQAKKIGKKASSRKLKPALKTLG